MEPWPRNPMQKLYADYFDFHFTNELTPKGRNGCYICYEVPGNHSTIPLARGVFENQFYPKTRVHAEICFLNWFKESLEKTLGPGEQYDITWYMSWSPCVECAKQVAEFLNTHKHVRLRMTFSRLYYGNKQEYRQGLRSLAGAGAEVAVMSPEVFEYCWDNFVDNGGMSFRYWKGIRRNYYAQDEKLHEFVYNPIQKLYVNYFNFHFSNEPTPKGRNGCYICYEVQGNHSTVPLARGVFVNQFYPKTRVHAEICFLNWFKESPLEKTPGPGEQYDITWYMSWSPCVECAKQVAEFLHTHKHVRLRMTFSRLYYGNKQEYRQGLRSLAGAGAELAVMSPEDFEYCWDNFVDNGGMSFWYWKGIRRNYYALDYKLKAILCKPMETLLPNTYILNFHNLLPAPVQNNTYICFQVEERKYNSPNAYYWGVFRNQPSHLHHLYPEEPVHAEQRFLSWFYDTLLSPHADYRVTWYMSWSPCFECAEEVVSFLGECENVSLSISTSRLYKCDDQDRQEGLRLLDQAGIEVAVMSPEDFEYCWDNFVDNGGIAFCYWKGIRRNYYDLVEKLHEIVCKPMDTLPPNTYILNFHNLLLAPVQNTYICFQVEERKYNSPNAYYWGVFRNQPSHLQHVYPEEPLHAEQRFLSWFYDTLLSPHADYCVTWYMSWSLCFECAEEVVSFLGEHENVSLSIFASRLYKCDDQDQQEGLRLLDQAGIEVAVMSPEDFEYCWDNFVDNGGMSCRYWKVFRRNYYDLVEKLHEIV
ncbi:LOW QUALITY PROTEIN: DNA dC-_dU-editing enzyme APOBEC-3D-like [Phyllostomus hastatus]|uniref:LOW QUALITY PROTEIN: DNA dC->dU-editing enzyme APOBEC-3D-like n=1 Tax=Phyllostomus hastatus TaxID=9423 RepID=UPI001E684EEB|nr:LOW QUALITY PROTEIN: DNA dC->dU-editing enzyme APOBEC-3D-like [Phyllostomus hastatus]